MSYLIAFLGWLGIEVAMWPVWGILLLTLTLIVGTCLLFLIAWILLSRAARAGWTAQSETSQAKAKAYNDSLTASRLNHERSKAEAVQAADLAKIRNDSQHIIDGPQREVMALKKSIDEHRSAIAERDATLVQFRESRDLLQAQADQLREKIKQMETARGIMLSDADDHQIERQRLHGETTVIRQQLLQAQAEIDRLHASLRDAIARIPGPLAIQPKASE